MSLGVLEIFGILKKVDHIVEFPNQKLLLFLYFGFCDRVWPLSVRSLPQSMRSWGAGFKKSKSFLIGRVSHFYMIRLYITGLRGLFISVPMVRLWIEPLAMRHE